MNFTKLTTIALSGALLLTGCAADVDAIDDVVDDAVDDVTTDDDTDGDDTASAVSFGGVADGDTVASPVAVTFEAGGFSILPAGEAGDEGGHMHVMIDTDCVEAGTEIVKDESHLHFGDGSTSTELELEPGEHTLCLQAGDDAHIALDITHEITITVE